MFPGYFRKATPAHSPEDIVVLSHHDMWTWICSIAQFLCCTLLSLPEHIRQTELGTADSSSTNQASGQHDLEFRRACEHTCMPETLTLQRKYIWCKADCSTGAWHMLCSGENNSRSRLSHPGLRPTVAANQKVCPIRKTHPAAAEQKCVTCTRLVYSSTCQSQISTLAFPAHSRQVWSQQAWWLVWKVSWQV